MVLLGQFAPAGVHLVDGDEQVAAVGDRVDRAAVLPGGLLDLDVPALAGDGDFAPEDAAAQRGHLQAGGLGDDDADLGAVAAVDQGEGSHPAGLLLGDRGEAEVFGEHNAGVLHGLDGGERGGHTALHVAGTATVDAVVRDAADERALGGPARSARDNVAVAEEHQGLGGLRAGLNAPHNVGSTGEVAVSEVAGATLVVRELDRGRLPLVDNGAEPLEVRAEVLLDATLAADGRVFAEPGSDAGDVDHVAKQLHGLVKAGAHGRNHSLL